MNNNKVFEKILGLSSAWKVSGVVVNDEKKTIDITVQRNEKLSFLSFFKKQEVQKFKWQDTPIGGFVCNITLRRYADEKDKVSMESWMPKSNTTISVKYFNHLQQLNALWNTRSKDSFFRKGFYITGDLVEKYFSDGSSVRENASTNGSKLPGVSHSIWRALLQENNVLDIKSLPLKLFLAALKLKIQQNTDMYDCIVELHNFFTQREKTLNHEIKQVHALENRRMA